MSTTAAGPSRPAALQSRRRGSRRRGGVRRAVRTPLLFLLAVLGLTAAVLMAPTAVGGPASYVVTQGTSMLPTYEAGGVIVTRERPAYDVGDVVGYRNPQLGDTVVLHRIVDVDRGAFVMQGDNNDFLDDFRPTPDQVVGEAWFYVPRAGEALAALRQPLVFGLGIAALTFLSLVSPGSTDRRRRRHHAA